MKAIFQFFIPALSGFFLLCFGGGGGSSSNSSDTYNTDKRNAVESGAGISGDNSTISIVQTDQGAISRALDSFDKSSALNGQGFSQLLQTASSMFTASQAAVGQSAAAAADAYRIAQETKAGTLDNKTLIALALAGLGAVFLFTRAKR